MQLVKVKQMFDLTTIDQNALDKALQAAESKLPQTAGDPMLLFKARAGRDGWVLGQEMSVVSGEEVLLLAGSIERGYIAFEHRGEGDTRPAKKLGEVSAPLFSNQKANADELTSLQNADVSEQTSATVFFPRMKLQAALKGSTRGIEDAMAQLIGQILNRMRAGERTYLNPKLKLEVDSYQHKKWGVTYTPKLTVTGWADASGKEEEMSEALQARV